MKKIFTAFLLCSAVLVSMFAVTTPASAQVRIGVHINTGPQYYNPYYQPAPYYYAPAYYNPPAYYYPQQYYYQPAYYPQPYAGAIWVQGYWGGNRGYGGHERHWNRGHWRHR